MMMNCTLLSTFIHYIHKFGMLVLTLYLVLINVHVGGSYVLLAIIMQVKIQIKKIIRFK